jgi:hypothetical protein
MVLTSVTAIITGLMHAAHGSLMHASKFQDIARMRPAASCRENRDVDLDGLSFYTRYLSTPQQEAS